MSIDFDTYLTLAMYLKEENGVEFDTKTNTIKIQDFSYNVTEKDLEELEYARKNNPLQRDVFREFIGAVKLLARREQENRGLLERKRILLENINRAKQIRTKILRQIQDCNGELFKTNDPRFIADNAYLLRQANKAYTENSKDNQQTKQNLLDKKV